MAKEIAKVENWYEDLVFDLRKLAFDGIVRTKHAIGKRILLDFEKFGKPEYGERRIEGLAEDLGANPREIYRCIQFAQKYPEIPESVTRDRIPWREVVNRLLPEHRENASEEDGAIPPRDVSFSEFFAGISNIFDKDKEFEKWHKLLDGYEHHFLNRDKEILNEFQDEWKQMDFPEIYFSKDSFQEYLYHWFSSRKKMIDWLHRVLWDFDPKEGFAKKIFGDEKASKIHEKIVKVKKLIDDESKGRGRSFREIQILAEYDIRHEAAIGRAIAKMTPEEKKKLGLKDVDK